MDVRRMDSGHAIDYRTSDIDTLFLNGKEGKAWTIPSSFPILL